MPISGWGAGTSDEDNLFCPEVATEVAQSGDVICAFMLHLLSLGLCGCPHFQCVRRLSPSPSAW
eukprot:9798635-Karenia_brevis.AAC.1